MARRSNTQTEPETQVEASETTEESTTEEAPQAESKQPAAPVDLTAFKEAVTNAVANDADESTGDISSENLAPVNEIYRGLEGVKAKNQARGWVEDQMKAAIMGEGDFASLEQTDRIQKARAYVSVKDGLSAGGGSAAAKTPTDPTEAFIQRVVALRIAQAEVEGNVPEGVSSEWSGKADELASSLSGQVDSYRTWLASPDTEESPRGDAPEVSPVVRSAFKLAQGKGSGSGQRAGSGGPRRDIPTHVAQVFEKFESGKFLTVNEIAKEASTEYGNDRPSPGAVSAHLFDKKTGALRKTDTYEAVADEGKSRGARKL